MAIVLKWKHTHTHRSCVHSVCRDVLSTIKIIPASITFKSLRRSHSQELFEYMWIAVSYAICVRFFPQKKTTEHYYIRRNFCCFFLFSLVPFVYFLHERLLLRPQLLRQSFNIFIMMCCCICLWFYCCASPIPFGFCRKWIYATLLSFIVLSSLDGYQAT